MLLHAMMVGLQRIEELGYQNLSRNERWLVPLVGQHGWVIWVDLGLVGGGAGVVCFGRKFREQKQNSSFLLNVEPPSVLISFLCRFLFIIPCLGLSLVSFLIFG